MARVSKRDQRRKLTMPRHLQAMMGLLLALLWAPVTVHCQLETLSGFEFLKCVPAELSDCQGHDDPCETDSCASVESGDWRAEKIEIVISAPVVPDHFAPLVLDPSQPAATSHRVFPQNRAIPKQWRLTCRTVLAPRPPPLTA